MRALSKASLAVTGVLSLVAIDAAIGGELSTLKPPVGYKCEKINGGAELDLKGARVTFEDEFEKPSITPPAGDGPWFAPVHGGFGAAKFLPPRPGGQGPFFHRDGKLAIRMEKINGKWYSGIIQTVNKAGKGFAQRYGYFEIRAQFPAGQSNWPAFWLKSVNEFTNPSEPRGELDVIEAYGGNDINGYHSSVHIWPPNKPTAETAGMKHWQSSCYRRIPGGLFDGQYHTYGVDVSPEKIRIYFDRKEIIRYDTIPVFQMPLFLLVDLAYSTSEKRTNEEPSELLVDYVRVWQRDDYVKAADAQ